MTTQNWIILAVAIVILIVNIGLFFSLLGLIIVISAIFLIVRVLQGSGNPIRELFDWIGKIFRY